ncbi:MAG: RAMP superfamily CRISPR-associated protein [Chitinophagales bacterium]|nr:RAMP superfamily CRISPR-associated protein [Chitinophagales bacterium]
MSGINSEYNISLKVLTPVHIGGVQEKELQEGLDYLKFKDGATWKLDWKMIYQDYDPDEIANAIIKKQLSKLLENDIEKYAESLGETFGDTKVIKTFIKNGLGYAYIPGSSIKGAMKSWLHAALENEFGFTEAKPDLLGKFENDIFSLIAISDCNLKLAPEIVSSKTFNLQKVNGQWEGGWKHALQGNTNYDFENNGFVTDYECLLPEDEGDFIVKMRKPLSVSNKEFLYSKNLHAKKSYERVFKDSPIKNIFQLINNQVKKHIEKEIEFFKEFNQAEYCEDIIKNLESLFQKNKNLNENQCMLRLSAGSGFHGITGDFQFEDHTDTGIWSGEDARKYKLSKRQSSDYVGKYKKFKSRRIVFTGDEMCSMGFVLLSTTPFEKHDFVKCNVKNENISNKAQVESSLKGKVEMQVVSKDATNLKQNDEVSAEVIAIGKPFGIAKLFLDNYSFELEVSLSGIKNSGLSPGDKIKCVINSITKEGKIAMVKYIG